MELSANLNLGYSSPLLNVTSKLLFRIWALLVGSWTWTRAWVVDKNWWKTHTQISWNLVEIWLQVQDVLWTVGVFNLVCLTTHNVFRYRVVIFVFVLFFWNVESGCDILFWPKKKNVIPGFPWHKKHWQVRFSSLGVFPLFPSKEKHPAQTHIYAPETCIRRGRGWIRMVARPPQWSSLRGRAVVSGK